MKLDMYADAARAIQAPPEHAIAVLDALFDAMSPDISFDGQMDAIQRALSINATLAVMSLIGLVIGVDKQLTGLTGEPQGTLIRELRKQSAELVRANPL